MIFFAAKNKFEADRLREVAIKAAPKYMRLSKKLLRKLITVSKVPNSKEYALDWDTLTDIHTRFELAAHLNGYLAAEKEQKRFKAVTAKEMSKIRGY
jgi:hypothetical protein